MATYKVIQDIEAEDKFVGPLSLKQFVFAMGGAFFGYLCVWGSANIGVWVLALFLPPSLFGFFMAVPWSSTQPTEVWVLAKMQFILKPKKRIWDQAGLQDLVTITAPKKIEKALTKNLSQTEVKSRLKALAETIDSRGWAVKNSTLQEAVDYDAVSDRLISADSVPQSVPEVDVNSIPDMYDISSSSKSPAFDQMIASKDEERKVQLADRMERIRRGEPLENIDKNKQVVATAKDELPPIKTSGSFDEKLLAEELKAKKSASTLSQSKMHKIGPKEAKKTKTKNDQNPQSSSVMTTPVRPDILDLARNNDLNVATIARQANKPDDDDEVVISLR